MVNLDRLTFARYARYFNPSNYPDTYVVCDLETTGVNTNSCDIVEISAVKVIHNKVVDTFSHLVNPGHHIPDAATRVNGITDAMVENEPSFAEIAPQFIAFVDGFTLVGHNSLRYDAKVLERMCRTCGYTTSFVWLDTLEFAKKLIQGPYKLSALCDAFGITNEVAHRALSDCFATHEVYQNLLELAYLVGEHSCCIEARAAKSSRGTELEGKYVVMTGLPEKITRKGLLTAAYRHGADIEESVSQRTNYLIYGKNPGQAKMKAALENQASTGIQIISEEVFYGLAGIDTKELDDLQGEFKFLEVLDDIPHEIIAQKNARAAKKKKPTQIEEFRQEVAVTPKPQSPAVTQAQVVETGVNTQTVAYQQQAAAQDKKAVKKSIYIVLAFFLGSFGIHEFYAGHTSRGIIMVLFCWTFIPALIGMAQAMMTLGIPADSNGLIYK